jgi:copper(I)-binding protein
VNKAAVSQHNYLEARVIRSSRGAAMPRRILIAAALALVPLMAGCEAGNNAPTLNWHQPTDGSTAAAGPDITISNVFVLGAPIGAELRPGQNAGLFMGLVNTGPSDRLLSVSAPGVAKSVQLPGRGIPLLTQHRVLLTGPQPLVLLQDLVRPLTGGSVITITLTFANAPATTISVPVMPRASFYTTFSPAPAPVSASPSPSGKRHRGTGSASPSPTGSP